MSYTNGLDNPELYFQAKAWNGTGSEIAITFDGDEDMQPDLAWLKKRSATGIHVLHDSVRGATKRLIPNATDAETTQAQYVKSFDSDGITFGTDTDVNASGATAILWGWKANGSGSANTDGSINTTKTSANTTSGFSICQFTGSGSAATIGHGLGVVPRMIISKDYGGTNSWYIYHASIGNTHAMRLDTTDAQDDSDTYWNDTTPTSTVYSVGTNSGTNDTDTMISYVFAPVQGFSKFSSFIGNGNIDGSFVYTGFKPSFILSKNYGASGNGGTLFDNKRAGYNGSNIELAPDSTGADQAGNKIDILSNGFKIRNNSSGINSSGNTYMYMAFAEAPFVNSNGVPCNAR